MSEAERNHEINVAFDEYHMAVESGHQAYTRGMVFGIKGAEIERLEAERLDNIWLARRILFRALTEAGAIPMLDAA
jgi:hypothetical protein